MKNNEKGGTPTMPEIFTHLGDNPKETIQRQLKEQLNIMHPLQLDDYFRTERSKYYIIAEVWSDRLKEIAEAKSELREKGGKS